MKSEDLEWGPPLDIGTSSKQEFGRRSSLLITSKSGPNVRPKIRAHNLKGNLRSKIAAQRIPIGKYVAVAFPWPQAAYASSNDEIRRIICPNGQIYLTICHIFI